MTVTNEPPATEGQLGYIHSLLENRAMEDEVRGRAYSRLNEGLSKKLASQWIDRLKGYPPRANTAGNKGAAVQYSQNVNPEGNVIGVLIVDGVEVPRGSYALDTSALPTFQNDTTFYKLWIGERGGWKLYLLHGPEGTPVDRESSLPILRMIAANPSEAASRYGHAIGRCGICSRRLTNDESRDRGIGPICAGRFGW